MQRRRRVQQLDLTFRTHGGARPGAGRPPNGEKAGVPHRPRAVLSGREPVLVTMKVRSGITSLRGRRAFDRVLRSLRRVRVELGARVTHYSVQRDHVHLIVEASDKLSLSRGMQGLAVRIARGVNRAMNRKGAVFADRFHDRVLCSPRQVRNALAYVLCNARKHGLAPSRSGWLDPHSSAAAFDGWASTTAHRSRAMPCRRHLPGSFASAGDEAACST